MSEETDRVVQQSRRTIVASGTEKPMRPPPRKGQTRHASSPRPVTSTVEQSRVKGGAWRSGKALCSWGPSAGRWILNASERRLALEKRIPK